MRKGGPFLSILVASAQASVRSTEDIFRGLNSTDLDNVEGIDLDRIGGSEDLPRKLQTKATGVITISDSSFTKRESKVYQGTAAPIVGSTAINVEKSATFDLAPTSGQIYIGRNSPNIEGPLNYVAKTDNGSYWTLSTIGNPTTRFHNKGEEVVLAQGGNRVIDAGRTVITPQGALSSSVEFSTVVSRTIPDGEVSIEGVAVIAVAPGSQGNVPAGSITAFSGSDPFPGATVTNPGPFISGRDTEKDNDYRERIRQARQTKQRGTDLALETAVSGAISPDENKQISSSKLVRRPGRASYLYVDDGSGYEEITQGVGIEVAIESAVGGERDFTSLYRPVAKAFLVSANTAPFNLQDSAGLRIDVGGEITVHNFDISEFNTISSASGYEVAASINGDSDILFSARTIENGTRVILFAREDVNEDIQVLTNPGIDAAPAFLFPSSRRYTSLLYRNDRLLSKDGRDAVYKSNRFGTWSSFSGPQTLELQTDLTPAIVYTFVDQDFIDAETGYATVNNNSLAAWALVVNRKIPGLTAEVELDRLVFTSNLSRSSVAKVAILSGTLVTNQMFAAGVATGLEGDYSLDRATGQFYLKEVADATDKFTLGSEWTRAFIETEALPATTLPDDGVTYWAVDADATIVQHGVGVATELTAEVVAVTDNGFQVKIHADSLSSVFANVQPNDWAILYDPDTDLPESLRKAWRVVRTIEDLSLFNDVVIDKANMLAARGGHRAVALPQLLGAPNRVMAIGGYTQDLGLDTVAVAGARLGKGIMAQTEAFDSDTKEWTQLASMGTPRYGHTATTMLNGKVLVTGGYTSSGVPVASTEIYDPATDIWTAGPAMAVARAGHSATLLVSGKVLIAGGYTGSAWTNTSQEYNPGTNTFINPAAMTTARAGHASLLIPAGSAAESNNVFVAGGTTTAFAKTATVECYNIGTFTWSVKNPMAQTRSSMGLAVVDTGTLIVAGDAQGAVVGNQKTYATYTLATNTWNATAPLPDDFHFGSQQLFKSVSGDVLAMYGFVDNGVDPRRLAHYFYDGATWNALGSSLSYYSAVQKTGVQFVGIAGLADNAVMAVAGVSVGNLIPGYDPDSGVTTASHEQLDTDNYLWSYPDSSELLLAGTLDSRGLQFVRTDDQLQRVVIPAGANYTAPTFADAINEELEGAEALVYRTAQLRVSTNSFDEDGDLGLVASTISGPVPLLPELLPLPVGDIQDNLTGHFASVESGNSGIGIPQKFQVHQLLSTEEPDSPDILRMVTLSSRGELAPPSSGTVLLGLRSWDGGLNPEYWDLVDGEQRIARIGNVARARYAVGTFSAIAGAGDTFDTYRVGLRRDIQTSVSPNDNFVLALPYAMGPRDNLTVVVDGDTDTKRFVVPMFRNLKAATSTYGSTIELLDLDAASATIATSFGTDYEFNDFALYMRARAKSHSADATKRILWRYFRSGPEGEAVVVRYFYPATPDAEPALEVVLDQATTATGYNDSFHQAAVNITLNSGAERTNGTLRIDSRVGYARVNEASADASVFDTYLMTGFTLVEAERTLAGGTTRLRVQVPNNGVVAQGPQDSGLIAGQTMWYEAAAPSATTLFSGAFQIQSVGAFNAGTGQQDIFVPANTLHDGTSTWGVTPTPGTVSADGQGEVIFDPSAIAGDLYRVNETNSPSGFAGVTNRVAAAGRQYLRLRSVDLNDVGAQTTPTWAAVTNPDNFLHFQAPTNTAAAIVAAVNALEGVVEGTVIGTGLGVVSLATWDELDSAGAGYRLADGVNYIQRTVTPLLPTTNHQFLLRDPVDADLLVSNDWINEEVQIAPVLTLDVVKWLNTPCMSGLFTAAEVVASAAGNKVQFSSLTAGSGGSIEVQGGTANQATAAVVGTATSIFRLIGSGSYVTARISETDGFIGGRWVRVDNTETLPKTTTWNSGSTLQIATDGQWTTDAILYFGNQFNNSRLVVEKVGRFVAYHYPYGLNENVFLEGIHDEQYHLHVRSTVTPDSGLPTIAAANQGTFRIIRIAYSTLGVTFWIENADAVEETVEADLVVLNPESMIPGDKIVVSTVNFGVRNRQTWTVTEVGSVAEGGRQYANNTFRVALSEGTPEAYGPTVMGSNADLLQLREGVPNRLFKEIETITPDEDPNFVNVMFTTDEGYGYISASAGSVLTAEDKLECASGIFVGVDGYSYSVGLIGEANRIVYGDETDRTTYPGVAAAGASILVSGPRVKRARVAVALRVRSGLATEDLADRVRSAIAAVINQSKIGQSVALSDVVTAAGAIPGVVGVSIVSPQYSSSNDLIPVSADEKLLALDLKEDISVSFVGL